MKENLAIKNPGQALPHKISHELSQRTVLEL
jgi:hypothetical protein